MRAAYRLLAPGLAAAALASPAAAAPAKAHSGHPAGTTEPAGKATPTGKGGKGTNKEAKPAESAAHASAEPGKTTDTGDQETQKAGGSGGGAKPAPDERTGSADDTGLPPDSEEQKPPPPPPPPPRADEQQPRPYLKLPEPEKPSRKVELGPHAGVEYLPARGSGVGYGAGFAWGVHARIEIAPWMGFRVSFTQSSQPVTVPDGALGLPAGTHIDQPDLSLLLLRVRLEPTWVVSPRLRLWAGVGAGWGRISAPALTTSGTLSGIRSARRSGVMLEFAGELGGSFDVIPNWLTASLMLSGGVLTNETGEVFTPSQAFTSDGHRIQLDGLPHFGSSLSALLGVGVLL